MINQSHPIKLSDVMTSRMEFFQPEDTENIGMYVCGPTVYDRAHLGNIRSAVSFDVIYRTLCYAYGQDNVTYVRNYTDIDDKIISKSRETGLSLTDITTKSIEQYESDLATLRVKQPNYTPKVSENIPEIISMIERLVANGHAYESSGSVYFKTKSFENYGVLSGKKDFFKQDKNLDKIDSIDFALWKKDDDNGCESPWGVGRPGWHIECSAMAQKYLGETFDIHGGGIDLVFPHHENEIAQSCCDTGKIPAKHWIYNMMLTIEGKKMSKSDGNVLNLDQFMSEYGLSNIQARYVLLKKPHNKVMDVRKKDVELMKKEIDSMVEMVDLESPNRTVISAEIVQPMFTNFNTSKFINNMFKLRKDKSTIQLKAALNFLDLLPENNVDTA